MLIHHRGLYPDRFDTPFGVGTLIWAKDCHKHCDGCFHQDRFDMPIIEEDSEEILDKILTNSFTRGIVYGGFEWTEQYDELLYLLSTSIDRGLENIVYTHHTVDDIVHNYKELLQYKRIYIKCGEYDNTLLSATYQSYGVPLASTNQRIYQVGVDI